MSADAKSNAATGNTNAPILQAIEDRNLELALSLIRDGADVNCGNPLFSAVELGDKKLVAELIGAGADPNIPVQENCGAHVSPLTQAVQGKRIDLVRMLLDAGARPSEPHELAFDPLGLACANGYLEIAECLLNAGADPNLQGIGPIGKLKQGGPLYDAIQSGNLELVKLLLQRGADIELFDELMKITPLIYAAQVDDMAMVRFLAANGASINQKYGRRNYGTLLEHALAEPVFPLSEAEKEKRRRIADVMIALGADGADSSTVE